MSVLVAAAAAASPVVVAAQRAALDELVTLAKAGVGDDTILARIASQPCTDPLKVDQIAALKKAGLSGKALAALIKKCGTMSASASSDSGINGLGNLRPGVYLVSEADGWTRHSQLTPAMVATGQAGGNGSLLFPDRYKLSLPGKRARIVLQSRRPQLWVVVDPRHAARGGFMQPDGVPPGLENLVLAHLKQKRDRREVQIGSAALGVTSSGIPADRIIPMNITERNTATFVVTVSTDLQAGEYALISAAGPSAYRVYDFSVM